jgi:hypothetical protein
MKISFTNLLQEANNPELFEMDEAGELAYYVIKKMIGIPKNQWKPVDETFPDSQGLAVNKGYLGTTISVNRDILNHFSDKIRKDVNLLTFNFVIGQTTGDEKDNLNSWGAFEKRGELEVTVLFTPKSKLVDIKNELTRTLIHELNHLYDNEDFSKPHKDKAATIRNTAMNKMMADIKISKSKLMQIILQNKINVDENYIEFINWIFDFNEVKSLSKEVIYQMEYKSVNYSDAYSPKVRSLIRQYLSTKVQRNLGKSTNLALISNVLVTITKYIQQMIDLYNQRFIQS